MRLLTLLFITAIVGACSSEHDQIAPKPVAPEWTTGFPRILPGASSVDVSLKTGTSSKAYFVLADRPLPYSREELKIKAEFPDTSAIKYAGKVELNGESEWSKTFPLLQENTEYYSYIVLESRVGNILSEIKSTEFTTFSRQDTASFYSSTQNREVKYLVYRPEEVLKYPETKSAVCFSFADKNAVATDLRPVNLLRDGSPAEYIYHKNEIPMIVISMQSRTPDWDLSMIAEGVDHALSTYPIDENRIYLTGYGEGAVAAWNYAIAHPDQIAAIVPVSGRGDTFNACNLITVHVWAFHNQTDDIIASSNTKKMVNAIDKCTPEKELAEIYFPDAGHNCWKRVYDSNHSDWSKSPGIERFDIYSWMLSKSKR